MFTLGIQQILNVRAEVRSVSNFFWNHLFELIFHKFFLKTNRFSSLVTKPLRKNGISCTLNTFLSKYFFLFLFALIQCTQWNNLRFFPKACTGIINSNKFRQQGLQIRVFQQCYLKCKCETPYFEGELVPKTCKNFKISPKKNFLSGLVTKLENILAFGENL